MFPDLLREGYWHTTSVDRFAGILKTGFILPNPQIPDSERWGTSRGPGLYPYVRSIGGVSVFDFIGFDEVAYSEKCPVSSWRTFVPCKTERDAAIWIELDIDIIKKDFIDGTSLVKQWNLQKAHRHKIMPLIEAAHIGPVPIVAFRRVFKYSSKAKVFTNISESIK